MVRLDESPGARASALLTPGFGCTGHPVCDLLARPLADEADVASPASPTESGDAVRLRLRPFEVITLRFTR